MSKWVKVSAISICIAVIVFLMFVAGHRVAFKHGVIPVAPYPNSSAITEIVFDWSTHMRRAPGSDNWPVTWADDDRQYTSWGDGGGFGGTNSDSRVSLGFAQIDGSIENLNATNIWGGKASANGATFGGKSYGIVSIGSVLFAWVSPGSGVDGFEESRLFCSTDYGASWKSANWAFFGRLGLINPTFLQFGEGYSGARDSYVYGYAPYLKDASSLMVQKPGQIALFRVPVAKIMDSFAYEFFAGFDVEPNPVWTGDVANSVAVFEDLNGVGWNVSVSHNAPIGRYFLITENSESSKGNIGIFDSDEPWGPWTTVSYGNTFGQKEIEGTTFFWNFSNRWMSKDGKQVILVFSGVGSNDSWNTVKGTIKIGSNEGATDEAEEHDPNTGNLNDTPSTQIQIRPKPSC